MWKEYKYEIINLVKNLKFVLPVILVTALGYGYLLTHGTVNVDSLSADRYFDGQELLGQSRLMAPLLDKIFEVMDFYPFFVDFIGVMLLIMAAILFCVLFNKVSNKKLKIISKTMFACFFITYPLIMEIITYVPMSISIGLGFCLIAISLMSYTEFMKNNKNRYIIFSVIMLWFAISIYESFAVVYVLGVFIIKLLELLYADDKKKLIAIVKEGLLYVIPLLLAIMINYLFAHYFKIIFNIPENKKADKVILYFRAGISPTVKYLIHTITLDYIIAAFGYFPMTLLMVTFAISIIMALISSIKRKKISILLMFLGMQFSVLLLSLIEGRAVGYRMSQQFQLFVPIIMMLLVQSVEISKLDKNIKKVAMGIIFLILFYQVKDLYHWQYLNDIRYQKEKSDAILIGNEIVSKYNYEEKPVIFIGKYELPEVITEQIKVKEDSLQYKLLKKYEERRNIELDIENRQISQCNIQSYISFGQNAHQGENTPNIELIKFFEYLGYEFKVGTTEMYKDALKLKKLPEWPKEGSIIETKEYIVVNF